VLIQGCIWLAFFPAMLVPDTALADPGRQLVPIAGLEARRKIVGRQAVGQFSGRLFGYSHLLGGYAGGQAEFLRVPYADVGPIKVPDALTDEQVLFPSDVFPTGYMAADFCNLKGGETVAVWGCGPVGQFAIRSAFLLGAERVLAIDTVPERLALARTAGAETIDFMKEDVYERTMELTHARGADACIDAVGTEAEPRASADSMLDRAKTAAYLGTDRPHVLRQAIHCCRNFGTVSIVGVYSGLRVGTAFILTRSLRQKRKACPTFSYPGL
jgi:threonine dehydrogenase-like Zn-dependent dehydrogenase